MYRLIAIFLWALHFTNAGKRSIDLNFYVEMNTVKCVNGTTFTLNENESIDVNIIDYPRTINDHWCYPKKNDQNRFNFTHFRPFKNIMVAQFTPWIKGEIYCHFLMNKDNAYIRPQRKYKNTVYTEVVCKFRIGFKYPKRLTVEINGKVLSSEPENSSNDVDASIKYKFVDKEFVDIKCRKPDIAGYLSVDCPQYNYSSDPQIVNEVTLQILLERKHTESHIDCVFDEKGTKTVVRIYFLLNLYDDNYIRLSNGIAVRNENAAMVYNYLRDIPEVFCDININGLPNERIPLHFYSIEIRTIYYTYTVDDVIQFNSSSDKNVIWTFIQDSSKITYNTTNLFNYTMKREFNEPTAICEPTADGKKTEIIFVYKEKKIVPENIPDQNKDKVTYEDTSTKNPNKSANTKEFLRDYLKEIVGTILVIIFVLLIICLVICLKNRRKSVVKGEPSDVDYVNLDHNNPDGQFPKRLNEKVYIQPPKESNVYAVPVDINNDDNTYSVPYKQKLEDLYAKPLPKNQRGNNSSDDVAYAEIQFKTPENIHPKVINNNDVTYAEIHPVNGKDLYASVKPKSEREGEYANDFSRSAYVNAQSNYVEPAYCEVNAWRN